MQTDKSCPSQITRWLGMLIILMNPTAQAQESRQVGEVQNGTSLLPSNQLIQPAGDHITFGGRPVDGVLSPDGSRWYLKDNRGIVVVDTETWSVIKEVSFRGGAGGSMHGIALSPNGKMLYATTAKNQLIRGDITNSGDIDWEKPITLKGPNGPDASFPTGITLSIKGDTAYVALSRNNSIAIISFSKKNDVEDLIEIPVGIAPYAIILSPNEKRAYVSNWGGRHPEDEDLAADSAGTQVKVDERGIGSSGSVSIVDLKTQKEITQIEVGLHPGAMVLSSDGKTLYVANANSDTISVIDTRTQKVIETISVRPDAALPFGSAPNALALDETRDKLYVANAGNNAVAVINLNSKGASKVSGFIPTAWYPGALDLHNNHLYIANVKGIGSRTTNPRQPGWGVHNHRGSVQRVDLKDADDNLATYTKQVMENGYLPQVLRAQERSTATNVPPIPVPAKLGEPSVFEHVVYIIKENRTYDQIFGDLPQGNADPSLCIYPREVTPNHHALAEQFVLLDNWYCNGVNSADGHAWSTEGYVTDYLEKSFGGFTRSYTFGNDALSYSSSGFFWDNILEHGLSFRNYGEMDYAEPVPKSTKFADIYNDFASGENKIQFTHNIGIKRLASYSSPDYPGWNMRIPDVLRASVFIKELEEFEKKGHFPNFSIVYLPQDHTSGTSPGSPTPAAHLADNDLALGQIVEALSNSSFWPKTCIFVVEDDPQDGFDHVDGHRSVCLIASPYTKRGQVVSNFYNQTSVLHTMARILGIPPLNQIDSAAPLMTECFTNEADLTPYKVLPNYIPLDQLNPGKNALTDDALYWAEKSLEQNFKIIDAGDDDTMNRILWHAAMGADTPYPTHLAGAHGTGLKKLNLVIDSNFNDDDD